MKIVVVPVSDSQISVSLERAESLYIYEVEENQIHSMKRQLMDKPPVELLEKICADMLLCALLSNASRSQLEKRGVKIYAGIYGNPEKAVQGMLDNNLKEMQNRKGKQIYPNGCAKFEL